jgi:peptidoglycan hydrolase-like protein with peptidoglycan-binding domain
MQLPVAGPPPEAAEPAVSPEPDDSDSATDAGTATDPTATVDASDGDAADLSPSDTQAGPTDGELSAPAGERIRWIQRALNQVAGAGLDEDGRLGPRTRVAILRFQRQKGLRADGKVGAKTEAALVRAGAAAPSKTGSTSTPNACRSDARVADKTVLHRIALGVPGVPNETAIYLPPGLRRGPRVDLIVYLHGWERNREGKIICAQARTVDEYLRGRQFPLREALRDSGKNAVLVVPKLGTHSEPGHLVRAGGFRAFVDEVLTTLTTCGGWGQTPQLGRLILAAHSGGGAAIGRIAAVNGELVDHLTEIWMFDALYGAVVPLWERFLAARPNLIARFAFTTTGGTHANSTALAAKVKRPNVEIRLTRAANHCLVPSAEIGEFLARSRLENR